MTITVVMIIFKMVGRAKKKSEEDLAKKQKEDDDVESAEKIPTKPKDDTEPVKKSKDEEKVESKKNLKKPQDVLGSLVFGTVIAFAWRGVFAILIVSIVGENSSGRATAVWSYAIIVSVVAILLLTVGDMTGFFVSRASFLQSKKEEVTYVGSALEGALKFTVGLAYANAFKTSFGMLNREQELTACWVYFGIMLVIMVLTSIYLKKLILMISQKVDGLLEFIDDHVDAIDFEEWDRTHERKSFFTYARMNAAEILIDSTVIAAGLSVTPAVKATLIYYLKTDDGADTVSGVWVAFLVAVIITSVVAGHLGKVVTKASEAAGEFLDDCLDYIGLSYCSEDEEEKMKNPRKGQTAACEARMGVSAGDAGADETHVAKTMTSTDLESVNEGGI